MAGAETQGSARCSGNAEERASRRRPTPRADGAGAEGAQAEGGALVQQRAVPIAAKLKDPRGLAMLQDKGMPWAWGWGGVADEAGKAAGVLSRTLGATPTGQTLPRGQEAPRRDRHVEIFISER